MSGNHLTRPDDARNRTAHLAEPDRDGLRNVTDDLYPLPDYVNVTLLEAAVNSTDEIDSFYFYEVSGGTRGAEIRNCRARGTRLVSFNTRPSPSPVIFFPASRRIGNVRSVKNLTRGREWPRVRRAKPANIYYPVNVSTLLTIVSIFRGRVFGCIFFMHF